MSKALEKIRVVDLTNVLAGPLCTYQLALVGAEVIKVETPGSGDLARQLGADSALNRCQMGASFLANNSGKKSITINLKSPDGKDVFRRLVSTADVVVENFRPGVMTRLGLPYEGLKAVNPQLIYCAISGFGQDGPLKNAPAYDQIIQGFSGVMSITGDEASAPLRVGYPVADTISGVTAAFAITSALVRRFQTGEGAFIDVSMLDSTLVTMGWVVSNYLIAGVTPTPFGNNNFTAAPSGAFHAKDGLMNIAANKQEQFEALVQVMGRGELISDPRFADREDRKRNRAALTAELERTFLQRTVAEWVSEFNSIGVPAGPVSTVPQALASAQIRSRELLQHFDEVPGVDRPINVMKTGFKLSGGNPVATMPPPRLGEHTDELLDELGYAPNDINHLKEVGAI